MVHAGFIHGKSHLSVELILRRVFKVRRVAHAPENLSHQGQWIKGCILGTTAEEMLVAMSTLAATR